MLPKVITHHLGIWVDTRLLTPSELLTGYLIERIVGESRGTDGHTFLQEVEKHQLHHQIVDGQHPLATGQTGKLLYQLHVFYEVHVSLVG